MDFSKPPPSFNTPPPPTNGMNMNCYPPMMNPMGNSMMQGAPPRPPQGHRGMMTGSGFMPNAGGGGPNMMPPLNTPPPPPNNFGPGPGRGRFNPRAGFGQCPWRMSSNQNQSHQGHFNPNQAPPGVRQMNRPNFQPDNMFDGGPSQQFQETFPLNQRCNNNNNNNGNHRQMNNGGRGRGGFRGRGGKGFRGGNHGQPNHQQKEQQQKKQKKERVDKRDLPENNAFFCDICERGFKTEEKYKEHVDGHQKCSYPGCSFIAAPKLVQLHVRMQHHSGLAKKVWNVESKEDINKWIQERKRNYPTAENIAKKKELQKEKSARGEVLQTKDFGKMRGRGRGRGRQRGGRGGRGRWQDRNLHKDKVDADTPESDQNTEREASDKEQRTERGHVNKDVSKERSDDNAPDTGQEKERPNTIEFEYGRDACSENLDENESKRGDTLSKGNSAKSKKEMAVLEQSEDETDSSDSDSDSSDAPEEIKISKSKANEEPEMEEECLVAEEEAEQRGETSSEKTAEVTTGCNGGGKVQEEVAAANSSLSLLAGYGDSSSEEDEDSENEEAPVSKVNQRLQLSSTTSLPTGDGLILTSPSPLFLSSPIQDGDSNPDPLSAIISTPSPAKRASTPSNAELPEDFEKPTGARNSKAYKDSVNSQSAVSTTQSQSPLKSSSKESQHKLLENGKPSVSEKETSNFSSENADSPESRLSSKGSFIPTTSQNGSKESTEAVEEGEIRECLEDGRDEGEMVTGDSAAAAQDRKRKLEEDDESRDGSFKKRPKRQQRRPMRRNYTLLEKLLAPDIRRERNKILQCVHYIVKNKFFMDNSDQSVSKQ